MSIDYKKPIRLKTMGCIQSVKYLTHLQTPAGPFIGVMVTYGDGEQFVLRCDPFKLENIPQSRWLNVCEYDGDIRIPASMWRDSRQECDSAQQSNRHVRFKRVAIIEDKQDGSPWILHQL